MPTVPDIPASTTATMNGEPFTFDRPLVTGFAADGRALVFVPSGTATILSRGTAPTTVDGFNVHGTMKNPIRRAAQGWDARMNNYSAGANATFPMTITAGDTIVACVSRTASLPTDTDLRFGVPAKWVVLHVVASAPPLETYFAPAAIGWSGRGTPQGYSVNIDADVAAMQNFDISGMPHPTVAQVLSHMGQHCPVIRFTDGDVPNAYEAHLPFQFGGFRGNYGQYVSSILGAAYLLLNSNVPTFAEKREMYIWLIRHGIDAIDPCIGDTVVTSNGGGHSQFQLVIEALALQKTGRAALISTIGDEDKQNATRQLFRMTPELRADLEPHSDVQKPFMYRLRSIPPGGVSGNQITLTATRTGNVGDSSRIPTNGSRLVRYSDGASAAIVGPPQSVGVLAGASTTFVIDIDAQPVPPFSPATDDYYFLPPYKLEVGQYDYAIGGTITGDGWNFYDSHSFGGAYRSLNDWGDEVLGLRLFGLYDNAFDGMEGYTVAVNAGNYPDAANAFPSANDVVSVPGLPAFTQAFWDRYSVDLIPRIAPLLSGITASGGQEFTSFDYSTNHTGGTVYWLVSANATRTAAQIKAGGEFGSGSVAVTAFGAQSQLSVAGVTPGTRYWHVIHEKASGVQSAVTSRTVTVNPVSSYQAETTALLASFTVQPSIAQADATDAFIASLKASGTLQKHDFIYGGADNAIQRMLRNWKGPGVFDAAAVGAVVPNGASRGFTGFGAANYLTTGGYKSWFTGANLADQDNHSIWFWRSDTTNANHYAIGNARMALGSKQFGATVQSRDGNTVNSFPGSATRQDGLWVLTRNASGSYDVWGNNTGAAPTATSIGLLATVATASGAALDSEVIIGAANGGTGTITQQQNLASTAIIAFAGGGAALTSGDIAALNAAIWNYLNTLGRL